MMKERETFVEEFKQSYHLDIGCGVASAIIRVIICLRKRQARDHQIIQLDAPDARPAFCSAGRIRTKWAH